MQPQGISETGRVPLWPNSCSKLLTENSESCFTSATRSNANSQEIEPNVMNKLSWIFKSSGHSCVQQIYIHGQKYFRSRDDSNKWMQTVHLSPIFNPVFCDALLFGTLNNGWPVDAMASLCSLTGLSGLIFIKSIPAFLFSCPEKPPDWFPENDLLVFVSALLELLIRQVWIQDIDPFQGTNSPGRDWLYFFHIDFSVHNSVLRQ